MKKAVEAWAEFERAEAGMAAWIKDFQARLEAEQRQGGDKSMADLERRRALFKVGRCLRIFLWKIFFTLRLLSLRLLTAFSRQIGTSHKQSTASLAVDNKALEGRL